MIKGLLFDLDATLTDRVQSAYNMYRFIVESEVPEMDPDSLAFETIVQRMMLWDEYGTIEKEHIFERTKRLFIPHLDVEEWSKRWYEEFYLHIVLQKNCIEILKRLKEKYLLGIVTNGSSFSQNKKIDYLGLRELFDTVIVSEDFGIRKPDPSIFLEAAKNLELEPNEVAFIGDTFATDVVGAIQAGMLPIWFSREHLCPSNMEILQMKSLEEVENYFLERT
ncbi:MAG: HAD family hydrolase [Solobacterium sp.]|nr:HAD family hydrolase [Solobacterium sp.]